MSKQTNKKIIFLFSDLIRKAFIADICLNRIERPLYFKLHVKLMGKHIATLHEGVKLNWFRAGKWVFARIGESENIEPSL